VSQQDPHLTTEQLSALLDKQLSPEEQAACRVHLIGCEQCQDALDNVQLTVNLLRSLPQLEVPHSFALPRDFKIATDANSYDDSNWMGYQAELQGYENERVATKKKSSSRKLSTPFRRTLRTVSALAAVVGMFFALSGFIATLSQLHIGGGASSASTMSAPAPAGVGKPTSPVAIGSQSRQHEPTNGHSSSSTTGNGSNATNTANQSTTPPHQPSNPNSTNKQPTSPTATTSSTATWLPLIDFNLPGTRLSIGILLAILGGMGYRLFTRQQK
jgi:Putative zinc-finger